MRGPEIPDWEKAYWDPRSYLAVAIAWPDATKAATADALLTVAAANVISPVRHYLDGLKWDGTGRIDGWLTRYCGAEPSSFVKAAGTAWLVSAVARALQPGCKADYALVLEGTQGAGKSSAIRALGAERRCRCWCRCAVQTAVHTRGADRGC